MITYDDNVYKHTRTVNRKYKNMHIHIRPSQNDIRGILLYDNLMLELKEPIPETSMAFSFSGCK